MPREKFGIARHELVEGFLDLATEDGVFVDQVAALAAELLELEEVVRPGGLEQSEAVDGGAKNGSEVYVVGLVIRVGGPAELFGGKGMDKSGFKVGVVEGVLDRAVIGAGAFDGDDDVAEVALGHDDADLLGGSAKGGLGVVEGGGFDQDVAVEVA